MSWLVKYGPIRRAQIGPFLNNVIVSNPQHIRTILSTGGTIDIVNVNVVNTSLSDLAIAVCELPALNQPYTAVLSCQ